MIEFERFTLENGLKVIVHSNLSVPTVAVDVLYNVGARDEEPHKTGLAHLFEHLMFEGSVNIPQYDTPLQLAGGHSNAFTTNDITNYYLSLPANQIETALWLESDRMLGLDFSQDSLDVQKSVVIEEYKQRYLNQPYGDAYLLIRPVHYTTHPYQWATIGKSIQQIEQFELQDIKDFFYHFYAPNNAILVITGNISFSRAKELVIKWFADIPYRDLRKRTLPQEPPQTAHRQLSVEREVPLSAFYRCYHIPERMHPDFPACDMITELLASGKNSIFYKHLIQKTKVANSATAFHWASYDPGMVSIDAKLNENVSFAQFEQELHHAFEELHSSVQQADIDRINNKLAADNHFANVTMMNLAMDLAMMESLHDASLINTWQKPYYELTPEKIRSVLDHYFSYTNATTLYYQAKPKG